MDNHEKMDKFLERYNFSRLNQEELENINRRESHIEKTQLWLLKGKGEVG